MIRTLFLTLMGLAVAGCATSVNVGAPRPEVLRDVEGYAIASCLNNQADPALKDQGDAWASVIVQRAKGNLDSFTDLGEQVKRECATGDMAVMRDEANPREGKALPVLYCAEIIDSPPVRAAIQKAVEELNPSYEQ